MKIRSDFVTNSSSSSFGFLSIKCKPLVEMLENYDKVVRERGLGEFLDAVGIRTDSSEGDLRWDWDEWCPFEQEVPESLDRVLSLLCSGIVSEMYQETGIIVGLGPRELVGVPIGPLVRAIAEHRDEIEDSIESVYWDSTDSGWGGDSDSRYYRSSYSPAMLAGILQRIASKKGCLPGEVTDYDFNMEVGGYTSNETEVYEFDRAAGIERRTHDFKLV